MAAKGERTRQAILDAAIARFGREGYRATSVAQVARDAGVSGTLVYAYFADKEALFRAAVDADADAVGGDALARLLTEGDGRDWRRRLIYALVEAVDAHPLTRRILAGHEPDVIDRVLEIDTITQMRAACAELIRAGQAAGTMRDDIDPVRVGNGIVTILLSILMSVLQVGRGTIDTYRDDVDAVFDAALDPIVVPPRPARRYRAADGARVRRAVRGAGGGQRRSPR